MAIESTIDAIIEYSRAVEPWLPKFEKKYKLLSPYFYRLYQSGKFEEQPDFVDWAGLYRIKLNQTL